MKLATLHDGSRDGRLAVVSHDLRVCVAVPEIARTLQDALDRWPEVGPRLAEAAARLDAGAVDAAEAFEPMRCMAPLPRAYQWIEALPTPAHVARLGATVGFADDDLLPGMLGADGARPFLRQGASDGFAGPGAGIPVPATSAPGANGRFDTEPGLAVLLGDVPMGTGIDDAGGFVHLVGLYAGVVQRTPPSQGLAPGMALFESRPLTLFAPVVVTPDELGAPWNDGRAAMGLTLAINGERLAELNPSRRPGAGFGALIVAAAQSRALSAGTLLGSGPLSSGEGAAPVESLPDGTAAPAAAEPPPAGSIAEWRDQALARGVAREQWRAWLRPGDSVSVEAFGPGGESLFGAIHAPVLAFVPPRRDHAAGPGVPAGTAGHAPVPAPLPEIALLLGDTGVVPLPAPEPDIDPGAGADASLADEATPLAPAAMPDTDPGPALALFPDAAPDADAVPPREATEPATDPVAPRNFASPVQMLLHSVPPAAPGNGWPAPLKPLADDAEPDPDAALFARWPLGEDARPPGPAPAPAVPRAAADAPLPAVLPAPARYHLYGFWRSSSTWRVRLALALKGLDWDTTPTDIVHARAQDRPAFRALTPQTRVPVLEDRDTGLVLTQSMAILDWLEQVHPAPPLLPADPLLRARVMVFCQTVATDIQPLQNTGVMSWLGNQLGVATNDRTRWARHWIERGLQALEAERNLWLAGQAARGAPPPAYCFTDHPTWADCCLVPQIFNARRFGCDLDAFAGLARLAERLEGAAPFQRAHPDQQPDARPDA